MVVILLFIGIAVQPSIAVNPISSDNEDDCEICPSLNSDRKQICEYFGKLIERLEPWGALFEGLFNNNVNNPISLRFIISCLGLGLFNLIWIPICFLAFEVFDCINWNP